MAAGYACHWGDDVHGASILVTWLDNGATISLCPEHFAPMMINIVAVDLGVDPERFYDGIRRLLDREAKRQADTEGKDSTDGDSPDGAPEDAESTQLPDPDPGPRRHDEDIAMAVEEHEVMWP